MVANVTKETVTANAVLPDWFTWSIAPRLPDRGLDTKRDDWHGNFDQMRANRALKTFKSDL